MRVRFAMFAALFGIGAMGAPVAGQNAAPAAEAERNALCQFHGAGCDAPPSDWAWRRLGPKVGVYSVELPCDPAQADRFGQVVAMSRAQFPAGNTRACMKASSGFTATLFGFADKPSDAARPEIDAILRGQPDVFSAFLRDTGASAESVTTFKGRRAVMRTIDKDDRRSRVVLVEVGPFGVIMLAADINSDFPGTREEGDAAMGRFIESLEIAA